MNNYAESKKQINDIRRRYGCKGDVIFRTAIQYIVEHGQYSFKDNERVHEWLNAIDEKHDEAERNGKRLWIGREFEKALIECAVELAVIKPYDLLIYIQKEVWLSGDGIDYQRAMEMLKDLVSLISDESCYYGEALSKLYDAGFDDTEIEELGFADLLDVDEEDDGE